MTKYILAGGHITKAEDGGESFAKELIKGLVQPIRVLICMFAREKENWEDSFKEAKSFFLNYVPGSQINFELAEEERFLNQLEQSDVLYIKGGVTKKLLESLEKQKGWENKLENMTVAGTSAGAYALATYHIPLRGDNSLAKGFGLVPIKTVAHYRSDYNAPNIDWDSIDTIINNNYIDLESVALKEGEFKVFQG